VGELLQRYLKSKSSSPSFASSSSPSFTSSSSPSFASPSPSHNSPKLVHIIIPEESASYPAAQTAKNAGKLRPIAITRKVEGSEENGVHGLTGNGYYQNRKGEDSHENDACEPGDSQNRKGEEPHENGVRDYQNEEVLQNNKLDNSDQFTNEILTNNNNSNPNNYNNKYNINYNNINDINTNNDTISNNINDILSMNINNWNNDNLNNNNVNSTNLNYNNLDNNNINSNNLNNNSFDNDSNNNMYDNNNIGNDNNVDTNKIDTNNNMDNDNNIDTSNNDIDNENYKDTNNSKLSSPECVSNSSEDEANLSSRRSLVAHRPKRSRHPTRRYADSLGNETEESSDEPKQIRKNSKKRYAEGSTPYIDVAGVVPNCWVEGGLGKAVNQRKRIRKIAASNTDSESEMTNQLKRFPNSIKQYAGVMHEAEGSSRIKLDMPRTSTLPSFLSFHTPPPPFFSFFLLFFPFFFPLFFLFFFLFFSYFFLIFFIIFFRIFFLFFFLIFFIIFSGFYLS
jgi:hypothetical protein